MASTPGYPHHVVIDHVSASWTTDKILSIGDARDVTVSWSLLAEPLHLSAFDLDKIDGDLDPPPFGAAAAGTGTIRDQPNKIVSGLAVGDQQNDKEYRAFLSFPMSGLPADLGDANVAGARLRLQRNAGASQGSPGRSIALAIRRSC